MATQPVSCPVTQIFGANPGAYARFGLRGHEGKDYGCGNGTPVYNAKAGVVGLSSGSYGAYGVCLVVRTTGGEGLIYAHLSRFLVRQGQGVAEGQLIAYTDNTGNSTGPHLHFGYQPQYMSNLNNGYFGCANPDVLFNQGGGLNPDDEQYRELLAEMLYLYGPERVPSASERRLRLGKNAGVTYGEIMGSKEAYEALTTLFTQVYRLAFGPTREIVHGRDISPRIDRIVARRSTFLKEVAQIADSQERKDYLKSRGGD